jgi:hypothetical protein
MKQRRLGEWEAEIETRTATLRAKRNGEGQPLAHDALWLRAATSQILREPRVPFVDDAPP